MDNLARFKELLNTLLNFVIEALQFVRDFLKKIWYILHTRFPILGDLVRRHTNNPTTVLIDLAMFILSLYLIFGLIGYNKIYIKKSETKFASNISQLYPYPAVKVGNSIVWTHEFLTRLGFLNTFNQKAPSDTASKPPTDAELRERVITGLIEDRIIYLEAKKRNIRITPEELKTALEKQGLVAEIEPKIKELYGMSLIQFKVILSEQLLKEKVKNAVLIKYRVRHILTLDLTSANVAKKQLADGRDFAEVAKEFSQDAKTAESGGDLGYWRKGELASQISDSIEEVASKLEVNQISDPIQTPFGYQIIQITEKSEGANLTYEQWYKETSTNYKIKRYVRI